MVTTLESESGVVGSNPARGHMLIEILMLPLLSALTLGLFGRFLGRFGSMVLSTFNM